MICEHLPAALNFHIFGPRIMELSYKLHYR